MKAAQAMAAMAVLGGVHAIGGCEPSATKLDPVPPTSTSSAPEPTVAPSASASAVARGTKTLFVSETLVDCEGEGPMKCMQVRASEKEAWSLFYGAIEGFTHDPAFSYELRVTTEPVAKPPADGSSVRTKLVEVVTKKPASGKK